MFCPLVSVSCRDFQSGFTVCFLFYLPARQMYSWGIYCWHWRKERSGKIDLWDPQKASSGRLQLGFCCSVGVTLRVCSRGNRYWKRFMGSLSSSSLSSLWKYINKAGFLQPERTWAWRHPVLELLASILWKINVYCFSQPTYAKLYRIPYWLRCSVAVLWICILSLYNKIWATKANASMKFS